MESDDAFFTRLFIDGVRKFGRVNHRRLFAGVRGRLGRPPTERAQDFAMFMRSKLRFVPSKVKDLDAIRDILKGLDPGREDAK